MNTALGTKKAGMVLLNTTSFSAVSSVSVPANTFSATYDNYIVRFNNMANSTNDWINIRMRASGSDDSAANYRKQKLESSGASTTSSRSTGLTSWTEVAYQNTSVPSVCIFEIQNPFLAEVTSAVCSVGFQPDGNIISLYTTYGLNTTTSYDSFTAIAASGTITGSISVYGINK
jgi:hypothetical protein